MTIGVAEGNEIQDHDILNLTKIEEGTGGMIRLVYPGDEPDKPLLTSEYFDSGKRSQAIIKWVAAVRDVMLEKYREAEQERKRRTIENRKLVPKPIELPDGFVPTQVAGPVTAAPAAAPAPTDPLAFARYQLVQASMQASLLTGEKARIEKELVVAERNLERWKTVLRSLGVIEEDVPPKYIDPAPDVDVDAGTVRLSGGIIGLPGE